MSESKNAPFTLLYLGNVSSAGYCVQAQYGGAEATLSLQSVNPTEVKQQWVYGEDERIYLANTNLCIDIQGVASNGAPLCLSDMNPTSMRQQWKYENFNFVNVAYPTYAIDDDSGRTTPGNKVQLWQRSSGNAAQLWGMQILPQNIPGGGDSSLRFSSPVTLLLCSGDAHGYWIGADRLAQNELTLSDAGATSTVQRWVLGSDKRVYPYVNGAPNTGFCMGINPMSGPIAPRTTLCLNVVVQGSATQQWTWSEKDHGITSPGARGYFVDNLNATLKRGNPICIFKPDSGPNAAERWAPLLALS